MTTYLLDTNVCVEILRGRGQPVLTRLEQMTEKVVGISVITLGELMYGAHRSARPGWHEMVVAGFMRGLELFPFDDVAACAFGQLRAELERQGCPIGPLIRLSLLMQLS